MPVQHNASVGVLGKGFGDTPAAVAEAIRLAAEAGLVGGCLSTPDLNQFMRG